VHPPEGFGRSGAGNAPEAAGPLAREPCFDTAGAKRRNLGKKTISGFRAADCRARNQDRRTALRADRVAVDISEEIDQLSKKSQQLTKDIYADLTPWQITKIARHAERPYTLDYVRDIFTDFEELHGDRHFADDLSIVGGLARFNGHACMVLGHQKGRDTKERALRNFGMARPEGYRKALRLMKTAEKFKLPVFTFVDTPGALSRHRRRGARPVRGHRPQHLRDGAARRCPSSPPSSAKAARAARWPSPWPTRC
jgi:hypothetical protein